ncbi:MAG TPA: hypothetical protein VHC69_06760 [Polyangiaceae bacterium]|nr:hypothetical protein [Polyangiaceae bacterium]
MRLASGVLWVMVTVIGLKSTAACGGDSGSAAGGKCRDLSGTWSISGDCPPSSCNFDQNGCQITMQCNDGTKASGTFNGSSLDFSGTGLKCSADVDLDGTGGASPGASGSCHSSQGTCTFKAACESGACTHVPDSDGGPTPVKPNPSPCQIRVATGSHQECDYSVCAEISDPAACCETVTDYKYVEGTMCSSGCTDLQTDSKNCAACGNACAAGESCVAGACAVVKQDGGIHGGGGGSAGAGGGSGSGAAPGNGGSTGISGGGGSPAAGGTTQVAIDAGTGGSNSGGSNSGGSNSGGSNSGGSNSGGSGGSSAGGSGGVTGSGGSSNGCHPPTTDGQCELVSRCGCASSQNCTYVGTTTKCIAPGGTPMWSACAYNSDCPAGAGCVGGVCRPNCNTAADCGAPGATYRACNPVTDDSTGKPFAGWEACTRQCNPMDPTNTAADPAFGACGDGANCIVSATGVSGTTNCVAAGSGSPGAACTSTSDCSAGLLCELNNGTRVCTQWCRMGHEKDDCPSIMCDSASGSMTIYGTCNALANGAVGTGSGVVQYGYCTLDTSGC